MTDISNRNSVETLNRLNHEEVVRQVPLIIYLTILSLLGITGNSLVFYVYKTKYQESTFRTFVIALSLVDLLTSSFAIPLEIIRQFWQYTQTSVLICKFSILLKTWLTITSGLILLAIASDRYRRICQPFKLQLSGSTAKQICIIILILGMAFSWMSPIIYSIERREHATHNLTVSECVVTEEMKNTLFPVINNSIFILLFIGSLTAIITLYCVIVISIKRHLKRRATLCGTRVRFHRSHASEQYCMPHANNERQKYKPNEESNVCTDTSQENTLGNNDLQNTAAAFNQDEIEEPHTDMNSSTPAEHSESESRISSKRTKLNQQNESHRIAIIMFFISLAFIISYLPLLFILLVRTIDKTFVASLSDGGRAVYKFFLRSYFLNCAINAVIYGILDNRFKEACKRLFAFKIWRETSRNVK